jgi:hypothetical protein
LVRRAQKEKTSNPNLQASNKHQALDPKNDWSRHCRNRKSEDPNPKSEGKSTSLACGLTRS